MLTLLLLAAPAPFLKPPPTPVACVVLAAPGLDDDRLAAKLTSAAFLGEVLKIKVPAVAPHKDVGWIRQRITTHRQNDGRSVEIAVRHCTPAEALDLLNAIAEAHIRAHLPERRENMARLEGKLEGDINRMPMNHRAAILAYFRELNRKESKHIVTAWPYLVRPR